MIFHRLTFCFWLLSCLVFFNSTSYGQKVSIFEVRKDLRLANDEPIFKDYYINGGFEDGLRTGLVIDVIRRIPIHDSLKNQSQGDLVLAIAKVRITHVQKNLSVARIYSSTSPKDRPIADFNAVMVGDEIDLSSAMMPVKVETKEKSAATPVPTLPPQPVVVLAPAEKEPATIKAAAAAAAKPPVAVGGEVTANKVPANP